MATASSGISFTGIVSGLDTNSIVTQLMAIEARPRTLLQQQQTVVDARTSSFRDISSKLLALKSAADGLRSFSLYSGSPWTSSSDPSRVTATATAAAAPGTYSLSVTQLAAANVKEQVASPFSTAFAPLYAGTGTYAGGTTKLTDLTQADGTSLGYAVGSTITLGGSQDGSAITPATLTVTASTTVEDLRKFVQSTLPGATATLGLGGSLKVTSPPGEEQAYRDLQLTAIAADGTTALPGLGGTNPPAPDGTLGSVRVHGTGRVHLESSGVGIDIDVNDGDSMDTVAAAINAKNGGLSATVANGVLRLTAKQTGAASAITVTPSAGVTLGTFSDLVAGQNATGSIGTKTFDSATNSVANVLTGVSLNLLATTPVGAPATLTVNPAHVDNDAIKAGIKAFVTAYNDVLGTIRDKTTEQRVLSPTTDADRIKGALFGDATLTGLGNALRSAMMNTVGGLGSGSNLMSSIGLSTGAVGTAYSTELTSGKLTLDEKKLDQALAGGTDAVKALLTSNGATSDLDGLMQRVSDISWNATKMGGTIASVIDGSSKTSADMTKRLASMQSSLDLRSAAMKAQFTAMESALAGLKNQSNSLASYMSSSSSSNN
jgi:flagellar hook-associated protein 2